VNPSSDDSAASTTAVIHGSIERQSPRLFFKNGRSAKTSNGFLFATYRLTSLNVRFVDRARQIGIEEALLHVRQFGPAFAEGTMPFTGLFLSLEIEELFPALLRACRFYT